MAGIVVFLVYHVVVGLFYGSLADVDTEKYTLSKPVALTVVVPALVVSFVLFPEVAELYKNIAPNDDSRRGDTALFLITVSMVGTVIEPLVATFLDKLTGMNVFIQTRQAE